MENKAIPDSSFNSSHFHNSLNNSSPRLASTGGWCPSSSNSVVYFKVSLQAVHIICAIGLQGHSDEDGYVTKYIIKLAIEYPNEEYYRENGNIRVCAQYD